MQDDADGGFDVGVFEVGEAGVEGLERLLGHGADEGKGDVRGREAYAESVFFFPLGVSVVFFFSFRSEKDLGSWTVDCGSGLAMRGYKGGRMALAYTYGHG